MKLVLLNQYVEGSPDGSEGDECGYFFRCGGNKFVLRAAAPTHGPREGSWSVGKYWLDSTGDAKQTFPVLPASDNFSSYVCHDRGLLLVVWTYLLKAEDAV